MTKKELFEMREKREKELKEDLLRVQCDGEDRPTGFRLLEAIRWILKDTAFGEATAFVDCYSYVTFRSLDTLDKEFKYYYGIDQNREVLEDYVASEKREQAMEYRASPPFLGFPFGFLCRRRVQTLRLKG